MPTPEEQAGSNQRGRGKQFFGKANMGKPKCIEGTYCKPEKLGHTRAEGRQLLTIAKMIGPRRAFYAPKPPTSNKSKPANNEKLATNMWYNLRNNV